MEGTEWRGQNGGGGMEGVEWRGWDRFLLINTLADLNATE